MEIIGLAFGVLCLTLAAGLRRDTRRARFWQRQEGPIDDRFVYLLLPGVGFFTLGLGLLAFITPMIGGNIALTILGVTLAVLAAAIILFGALMAVLGLFSKRVPTWALPRSDRRN